MIAWREFEDNQVYGFDVAHKLPVIAHVYKNSSDSEEKPYGWDLTVGIGSFHPGTFAGDDTTDVEAGRKACEQALAVWVAQLDARMAAERLAAERWFADRGMK